MLVRELYESSITFDKAFRPLRASVRDPELSALIKASNDYTFGKAHQLFSGSVLIARIKNSRSCEYACHLETENEMVFKILGLQTQSPIKCRVGVVFGVQKLVTQCSSPLLEEFKLHPSIL
jgi:hypothetical protein